MNKQLIARGQATITTLQDSYVITQSISNYIFTANADGTIPEIISFTSSIKVSLSDKDFTDFTIGYITTPTGFSSIIVDNTAKSITYTIAANTGNLAENGHIVIFILIKGVNYPISFSWAKSRSGKNGESGVDTNSLDWVKEWDNNKTLINTNTVITPKMFAGLKNPDGTISGIAIGHFTLNILDTANNITTEAIKGIYGFRNGYRTFSVDESGGVVIGRGDQAICYNADSGKVEFGSEVTLNWVNAINTAKDDVLFVASTDATNKVNTLKTTVDNSIADAKKVGTDARYVADAITGKANSESWSSKLTFIGSTGIFTGTLSANTINALQINASQIISGTIDAARINVTALKSSLITAANIEALALNVVRGKIGGWNIDIDSIYKGIKSNISEAYTSASGSITIGSNGIRGFKWNLDSTGAGALAGGNISWDANGNVSFGASVVLSWTTPINQITAALGGTSYSKLTYISGNGIYTGTLAAEKITSGTLSADRIAVSSIHASKLNAASIKSDLINTAYINGLNCTFVQGSIGGWIIGTNALYSNHISLDNEHKRIAVYGANSGTTSGQRVQLYYNNDADFGLYTTDSSGDCIVRLGASNYIAGWIVNTTQISKNNVVLGSDGSIVNGTKWRLNNDGSGQMAAGNIAWNAAGTVTFSASVSLNWETAIDAIQVGGSNLLNNSGNWRSPGWNEGFTNNSGGYTIDASVLFNNKPTLKTDVGSGVAHPWVRLENNVEYTYSAMVKCNKTITGNGLVPLHYWAGLDNQSQSKISVLRHDTSVVADTWKRIYITFKLTGDGNSFRPFFYRNNSEPTFYWIAYCKLEKGNKITDWCQSDADTNKLVADAQQTGNSVVAALGGNNFSKLTQISSTGIYTGTVNATQINAGILSADRIAAGSINASKLNVASIKSDIINTGYINGLTCTFMQGTIGGWTIGTDSIYNSHLVLDNSNKRIVVYGANSGVSSGKRVQFYYSSDTDFGLFATDENSSCIASLGSANQIAGWTINTSQIYKNNVYLGSDGSIANAGKWRLNNDGSGQVANGNIAWNSAGTVTFSSAVSMNWSNAANNGKLFARGTGQNHFANRIVMLNGNQVLSTSGRGLTLTVINRSDLAIDSNNLYDVYSNDTNCNLLASAMNNLTLDKIVILTSFDAISINEALNTAIQRCGGSDLRINSDRRPYVLIGIPGIGKDNGLVCVYGSGATEPYAEISTVIINGIPQGINTFGKQKTYIDGNGIYTGTLSVSQVKVNTALIVGGSTYDGSISVRDAANNVKVTLNRTGITAVGGRIGGWEIDATSIHATAPVGGHSVYITQSGYIYNNGGGKDYWGLSADGSATFGHGAIHFGNNGAGYVGGGNISWDAAGNVTVNGKVTAKSGLIAGFSISGNKLLNTAADSSIEFSSLIGNASLTINSNSALLSLRADSARTGIYLQTYATGAKGIYIVANAGSQYAIESYGPMQLGQRPGERWCVPGVLFIGCKYNIGPNTSYRKIWGDGVSITSCYHMGDSKFKFYHNLGHTDYTVTAQVWQSGYYGFFRLLERTTSYFVIQNLGNKGKPDNAPFDFTIMGRNKW